MAAITVCLALALSVFAIASIESAVIKLQEIPLKPGVTMKISIRDDPKHEGGVVASIKIGMDEEPKTKNNTVDAMLPAAGLIPNFEDRSAFNNGNGNCKQGEVRKGPTCVPKHRKRAINKN